MRNTDQLKQIAINLVRKGKGILAADESNPTCKKRFDSIGIKSSFDSRNEYRDMLFTSNKIEDYISGVILFDETLKQSTTCEKKIPFTKLLNSKGIIPGIKVDQGAINLEGFPNEKATAGLDGLDKRLAEYYELGARFAKWRGVYIISKKYPSKLSIYSNAHALARYSALVQESGMVPIVEPEVLMDGEHNINKCYEVTAKVLKECYKELNLHNVNLKGTILKPNMILPGNKSKDKSNTQEIAKMTLKCLKENVPSEVPGIAFLSGGQTEVEATQNLNEINKINDTNFVMSFSYGRALQQSALKNWAKDIKDTSTTQKIFNHRSKMNGLSTSAKWSMDLENQTTA